MVTSQEHLYLKGRQALPGKNASTSQSLADILATPLPDGGATSSSSSPAARQVAQALKDPALRRRLTAELEASSSESGAAASPGPLLGLGLSPSKVPAGDQDAFVFPIPSLSSSSTPLKASSSSSSKCLFLMNLKAGPSCDSKSCPPKKPAPQFATTLEGRIFSQNCAVGYTFYQPNCLLEAYF